MALALFACVGASAEALDRAPVRTGRGKQLVGPAVSVRLVAKHPPLTFTDTSTTLPLSDATAFVAGETFLVEVWAQTTHPSGLSAVSLDIQFDPLEVAVVLPGTPPFSAGIFHGLLFTGLTNGTADNVAGIVDDLSGSYVPGAGCAASPVGDGPINWVRVAIVEMQALVDGSPMIAPGPTGNPVFGTAACGLANSPESDITYTMINPPSVDFHLNVAAGSSNVQQGDNVTVTFEATNMNVLVNAVQGLLHYDNTMLTLTGITPFDLGLAPPANGWVEINETDLSGDVAYAAFITNGSVNADGVVGTLTLTATGVGTTSLSFLPDHPISFPTLINKATAAATAASIVPNTFGSGVITIGACDDGLTCTTDTFDGTNCVFTVNAGSCLIGGVCYNQGDSNPANGCEECNAAANNIDWTARVNGAPCNDANACTTGDTCSLGICVG
ncbi:MAG: cohesin domain-containing protein, partial [Phycisphaerae bacterium]